MMHIHCSGPVGEEASPDGTCAGQVSVHALFGGRARRVRCQPITGELVACSVRRDKLKRTYDAYCGVCIVGLYFLYLGLVKGALSVFDCTQNKDGVYILDADPSIKCNEVPYRINRTDPRSCVVACGPCRGLLGDVGGRVGQGWG
jgi:hypothetical protein